MLNFQIQAHFIQVLMPSPPQALPWQFQTVAFFFFCNTHSQYFKEGARDYSVTACYASHATIRPLHQKLYVAIFAISDPKTNNST